jgi:hypothetical protein
VLSDRDEKPGSKAFLKLQKGDGSLPSPAEPPIVTVLRWVVVAGGGRRAFSPFPGGETRRGFSSPEARRVALTDLNGHSQAGNISAAWLAHSLSFSFFAWGIGGRQTQTSWDRRMENITK